MLLFSRFLNVTGDPRRAMPWAIGTTAYVNAHSDLDVSLWSLPYGYPLGTVAWSAVVESQVALAAGTAGLLADDGYFDMVAQGQEFAPHPGEDRLGQFVHFQQEGEPNPIGAVANITRATASFDRIVDAIGWGVEIAQYVESVTGIPVAVLTSGFGQMGEITWISVAPDLASAEASGAKIAADTGYLGRMAATKELYIPGSGHVSQAVRIA